MAFRNPTNIFTTKNKSWADVIPTAKYRGRIMLVTCTICGKEKERSTARVCEDKKCLAELNKQYKQNYKKNRQKASREYIK